MSEILTQDLPDATGLYQEWLGKLPELTAQTAEMLERCDFKRISVLMRAARRVFCVGSGSSVATAWHLALSLSLHGGWCSSYVTTSQIVSMKSLGKDDLVVLVSQGFNRSDSAIVMHTARRCGTPVVVLTACPEEISAEGVIRFVPRADQERLFCRPCGAITSLMAGAALAAACLEQKLSLRDLCDATGEKQCTGWRSGRTTDQVAALVRDASLVIVLGSGELQPGVHNLALALREGAGKIAEFYEIEYYAHGQYAPHYHHQDRGGKVVYLLGEAQADAVSRRSVERITPLLQKTGAVFDVLSLRGSVPAALVSLLSIANQIVKSVILESGYDMNNPRGKEENRGFQLVEASYYE